MTSLAWQRRGASATRFWQQYRAQRAGLYGLAGLALKPTGEVVQRVGRSAAF